MKIGRKFGIDCFSSDLVAQAGDGPVSGAISAAAAKDSLVDSLFPLARLTGQMPLITEDSYHSIVSTGGLFRKQASCDVKHISG